MSQSSGSTFNMYGTRFHRLIGTTVGAGAAFMTCAAAASPELIHSKTAVLCLLSIGLASCFAVASAFIWLTRKEEGCFVAVGGVFALGITGGVLDWINTNYVTLGWGIASGAIGGLYGFVFAPIVFAGVRRRDKITQVAPIVGYLLLVLAGALIGFPAFP